MCFLVVFFQSQMSVNLNMCWEGVSNMKGKGWPDKTMGFLPRWIRKRFAESD